jgi:hypothetical protein
MPNRASSTGAANGQGVPGDDLARVVGHPRVQPSAVLPKPALAGLRERLEAVASANAQVAADDAARKDDFAPGAVTKWGLRRERISEERRGDEPDLRKRAN